MAKVLVARGVIEGSLLRNFEYVPPGTPFSGTFTLEEAGPKTYRLKCECRFPVFDRIGMVSSFTLKRAELPSRTEAMAAALVQLVERLREIRTSGGYQRDQVDRAEWLPAEERPPTTPLA